MVVGVNATPQESPVYSLVTKESIQCKQLSCDTAVCGTAQSCYCSMMNSMDACKAALRPALSLARQL